MRKSSVGTVSVLVVVLGLAVGATAGAAVKRDGTPTQLVKLAKSLGIKEAGPEYQFEEEERNGDTIFLTVEVPTAWSDRADSHFINPDTNEPYGAGLRATSDAEQFVSYDVPGVKITAGGLTRSQVESFDAADILASVRYPGCRKGSMKPFDNGVYEGKYRTFDRCDGERTAAVAVEVLGRGFEILVAGVVHTKADLAAIDRVLSSAKVEKTSV